MCIRDALYRLARSAMKRRAAGTDNLNGSHESKEQDSDANAVESSTASGPVSSRHSQYVGNLFSVYFLFSGLLPFANLRLAICYYHRWLTPPIFVALADFVRYQEILLNMKTINNMLCIWQVLKHLFEIVLWS